MTVSESVVGKRLSVAASTRQTTLDSQRVTRFFRAYASTTHRFLLRLGVSATEVDDVLQHVFMIVWDKLDTLRPEASERAWVLAIARRQAANHRRKSSRIVPRPIPTPSPTPEQQVSGKEAADLVRRFLDELDEDRRLVFHLSDVEGLTAPEIAEATGTKLNTVYTRLRKARQMFREYVARHLPEGGDD
jgi:RNA polymerase sigma-70 factor (ECF subfamily)